MNVSLRSGSNWNFDKKHFRNKTIGGGGGLPHERGGDARRLAWGCKSQILVSPRLFWAKHHYIQP